MKQCIFLITFLMAIFFMSCGSQKSATASGEMPGEAIEFSSDAEFTCMGNEPFWNIKIKKDGIVYSRMGEDPITFKYQAPEKRGAYTVYTSSKKKSNIRIAISDKPCSDTMSDEKFPHSVQVDIGGETLYGCAR